MWPAVWPVVIATMVAVEVGCRRFALCLATLLTTIVAVATAGVVLNGSQVGVGVWVCAAGTMSIVAATVGGVRNG